MHSGPGCGLEPAGLLDVSYSASACRSFFDEMSACLSNYASFSSFPFITENMKREGVKLKSHFALKSAWTVFGKPERGGELQ